ncbi:hypothetical protein LTR78_001860 [Recurvomyces mirabilis]|uniref:Karyogamy protein 5 n=1 Tax=Recurvomyces mirabilis TaxID=574656 RepID=A0AAE0WV83_9PEZI|nr:hypothetical protein LTR78_001860 [Recurvomyces mirabilis]KAK5156700.1 hypothetical protein LTS14_004912 [Recurvomyces mirabilis]
MWSLLLLCLSVFCNISSASIDNQVISLGHGNGNIIDAPSLPDYAFSNAAKTELAAIKKYQSLPTCERLATGALLTSCASLERPVSVNPDDPAPGADALVRDQQQLYAARLSVCRLNHTGNPIPKACLPLLPTERNTKRKWLTGILGKATSHETSYPDYERDSEAHAGACIKALYHEGNGQAWTTYETSGHSMIVTCRSLRDDVERDEKIAYMGGLTSAYENIFSSATESMERLVQRESEQERLFLEHYQTTLARIKDLDMRSAVSTDELLARLSSLGDQMAIMLDQAADAQRQAQTQSSQHADRMQELSVSSLSEQQQAHSVSLTLFEQQRAYYGEMYAQDIQQYFGQVKQDITNTVAQAIEGIKTVKNDAAELRAELSGAIEDAKTLNGSLGPILSLVSILETVLPEAPGFSKTLGGIVFFALPSFAFWQRVVACPTSGHITLSLASGWVLSKIWTLLYQNIDLDRPAAALQDYNTLTTIPNAAFCAVLVVLALAVIYGVVTLVERCIGRCTTSDAQASTLPITEKGGGLQTQLTFRLPINDPKAFTNRQEKHVAEMA